MSPKQWRIVLGLLAAVGVLAVVVGALALTGGDGRRERVEASADTEGSSPSTPTPETSTTLRLLPVGPSTTASRDGGEAGGPTETTDATRHAPVVGPDGAVLRRPSAAEERRRPPGGACVTMAAPGYRATCGDVTDGSTELVWIVEERLTTGGLRASLLIGTDPGRYDPVLEAVDDGPSGPVRFASIGVVVGDVSADGTPEIAFGFRGQGSGAILDVDLVDAPGRVIVHRTLDKGRAALGEGRLDDWSAEFGPNDAACCPSRYDHSVVRFVDGAWRVVESREVAAAGLPRGDFE